MEQAGVRAMGEIAVETEGLSDAGFEQMVARETPSALALARAYLKDSEEAKDAVQEAFIKAYKNRHKFRGDSSLRTWFTRILINHLNDRARIKKLKSWIPLFGNGGEEEPVDLAPGPLARLQNKALGRELKAAIDKLPAQQSEAVRLHLVAGYDLKETADIMGIALPSAKTHYFRAVKKLRESLKEWRTGNE